ncbi:hypothetical protein J717_1248 [Acinetobacter baumannii 121738]|nr:hypothetical protein J717_1248 [Acinetobacter baumannii 121738]
MNIEPDLRDQVLHRIDDLEIICIGFYRRFDVLHRIDDLETMV